MLEEDLFISPMSLGDRLSQVIFATFLIAFNTATRRGLEVVTSLVISFCLVTE